MSVKIDYNQAADKAEAYKIVEANITEEKIERFQVKADLSYDQGEKITAKGKGFTLEMTFYDSYLEMNLDLSFLLKPLRGKIEGILSKEITKVV